MKTRAFVHGTLLFTWLAFIVAPFSPIDVPFEIIAYGMMAVVGAYVGVDELASVVTSRKLPVGAKYIGNKTKLFRIVISVILIALTTIILAIVFRDIQYPVSTILLSAFSVITLYVSGEKGKTAVENTCSDPYESEDEDLL